MSFNSVKQSVKRRLSRVHVGKIWIFPCVLLMLLIVLTCLKISGSSTGVNAYILGEDSHDPAKIAFDPRGVRSDEWVVNTQMIVAQSRDGFPRVNHDIGEGQDMSLIVDVPYKEWSAVFKPQNLIFFVLPLEQAFAFKWWLLGFFMMLACYLFVLELLPKKVGIAVLTALLLGFTPFVLWWYQSVTALALAYSFFIMWLAMRLLHIKTNKGKLTLSLLLGYTLACFGLLLYPPFQIPCLLVIAAFLVGYLLDQFSNPIKKVLSLWPYLAISLCIGILVGVGFVATRANAIKTINNTVYPGKRSVLSGGPSPIYSFSSFLSPHLQYDNKVAGGYLRNQSEASNFIFIAPFLLLPSFYIVIRNFRQRQRKRYWGLLIINLVIVGFLLRMYVYTPWLEPIYRLLLFDRVPSLRNIIGVGMAGVLQILLLAKVLPGNVKRREQVILATFATATGFLCMAFVAFYTVHHFPIFFASLRKALFFAVWVSIPIGLVIMNRIKLALLLLVAFSFISVYKIHPLYRGLGPLTHSDLVNTIKRYPDNGDWVVLDDRLLINYPLMAGKPSLTGVNFYPQLHQWHQLDQKDQDEYDYNRFAHVLFVTNPLQKNTFDLPQFDLLSIKFEPCSSFAQHKITYILSPAKIPNTCVHYREEVKTKYKSFYIYQIIQQPQS